MSRENTLWIGGLDNYMDEGFILKALQEVGEENVVSVKIINNKNSGGSLNYGFINFNSDSEARKAMFKLNGKIIPNTNRTARFKLTHNSTRLLPGEKNFSIWVGELTSEVDDLQLFRFFSNRYQSVKYAKVVSDEAGLSRGFGFVRFGIESEQQSALQSMSGTPGLGSKPIRVNEASEKARIKSKAQKNKLSMMASSVTASDPSPYRVWQSPYGQNWSQYAAWNQYYQQYYDPSNANVASCWAAPEENQYYKRQRLAQGNAQQSTEINGFNDQESQSKKDNCDSNVELVREFYDTGEKTIFDGDGSDLVDHSEVINPDEYNKKYFARTEELWDSIESSRWWKDD